MKRFHVYHADGIKIALDEETLMAMVNFPVGYSLVAKVDSPELGDVFRLTNHIDWEWWRNPEVECVKRSRSTSVGDVVVDTEAGKRYLCMPVGWKELD